MKHYLVPDYILQFQCTCCTECCKRWRINIDKHTMERYKHLAKGDQELSAMLEQGMKKDKSGGATVILKVKVQNKSPKEDGKIPGVIDIETAVCPFLADDGLCAIQKKYGLDALSDTCKIFPRNIFLTRRGYEMGISYACSSAAQTLKNKNMIEFYQDPQGFDFINLYGQYEKMGSFLDMKKAGKTKYHDMEEMLIDIVQFREIDIDTRLILAGIVIDKLKDGDIPGIRRYLQNIDADMISQLQSIPSQPVFMMRLVKDAADALLLGRITEMDMKNVLHLAYIQLKLLDESIIADEKVEKLLAGYNKYYKPYLDNVSHVFENYFVNFIFSKKYYTHKYLDAYFLMVFFYILIRFFTICACMAEGKNVDEDLVVRVISAIERSVGHNTAYYEDVLRLVKEGRYHRLPYVISLINIDYPVIQNAG